MRKRNRLMSAFVGGACSLMFLTAQAHAQQPQANQPAQAKQAAGAETLRLPPEKPFVEVTVQAPKEVRVGQSFDYQIRVQNNSENVALHDLVIAQHAGAGFEIESSEVRENASASRDQQSQKSGQQQQQAKEGEKPEQAAAKQQKSDSGQREQDQAKRDNAKSGNAKQRRSRGDGSSWKIDRLMPGESQMIHVTAVSDSEGAGDLCVAVESYVPAVCLATRFTKPELEIVKQAPETANICDEIQFEYLVKNTGTGDLERFTVRDELPDGLRTVEGEAKLEFTLEDGLKAGDTRKFVARLRASDTGELTSRASVEGPGGLEARSNRAGTRVVKADLAVAIEGPQAQEVGGLANYTVRVTNNGDAPAPGAQLRVYFPRSADLVRASEPSKTGGDLTQGLASSGRSSEQQSSHQHGSQDEGQDAAKRKRNSEKAKQEKKKQQKDQSSAEKQQPKKDEPQNDDKSDEEKAASKEQSSDDQAASAAAQEADAQNAEAQDPKDRARRRENRENQMRRQMAHVHWQLGTLNPGDTIEVTYVLRPYEGGELEQAAVAEYVCETAQDREMLESEATTTTEVLMLTGLRVTVIDDRDPVPAGQNVTYTITVLNQGSAPASNIEISAQLPEGLKYVESEGATAGENSDREVTFEPVKTLEPGKKAVWNIVAGVAEDVATKTQGSIKVELNSDEIEESIVSQEPTTLFEAEKRTARSPEDEQSEKK